MSLIVAVQFDDDSKLYYFDPGDLDLDVGDRVLVETESGPESGTVALAPREIADTGVVSTLRKVVRREENIPEEGEREGESEALPVKSEPRIMYDEEEAFRICEERIQKRNMPMKLIDVEYGLEDGKIIFYFAADGRVDFRELVKDLASVFKTRIELRQIGVRDEAKKIGGLGPCGRPCCCNAFLSDFAPVSIKMAKEQSLSLSPTKISGLCGRLMCCLHYEHDHYHEMHKKIPHVGSWVETPDGPAEVHAADVLTGILRCKIALPDGSFDLRKYPMEQTTRISQPPIASTFAMRPPMRELPKEPEAEQEKPQEAPKEKKAAPHKRKARTKHEESHAKSEPPTKKTELSAKKGEQPSKKTEQKRRSYPRRKKQGGSRPHAPS